MKKRHEVSRFFYKILKEFSFFKILPENGASSRCFAIALQSAAIQPVVFKRPMHEVQRVVEWHAVGRRGAQNRLNALWIQRLRHVIRPAATPPPSPPPAGRSTDKRRTREGLPREFPPEEFHLPIRTTEAVAVSLDAVSASAKASPQLE